MERTNMAKGKKSIAYELPRTEIELAGFPPCTEALGCVSNFLPQSGVKPEHGQKEDNSETIQE